MPSGCNLYETDDDHKQILKSRSEGLPANVSKEVILDKRPIIDTKTSSKIGRILQESNEPSHKALCKILIDKIEDGEAIPENYKRELPSAVAGILKHTHDAMGIFTPVRKDYGKGAKSVIGDLHHKTRGNAYAYELLGTAALIEKEFPSCNGSDALKINSLDRLDFRYKLQASYNGIPSDYLKYQPHRGTVEADLFINRKVGLNDLRIIGIDFKHSINDTYEKNDLDQLNGIKVALATGEIDEFCFVSNAKFTKKFKDNIQAINEELSKSENELNLVSNSQHLTPEEQEESKAPHPPMIKIFENVRYRGT